MKNDELLKNYAGISTRIRRIFAYHYDQIQREVQTEISTLTPELQAQFMDLIIEYMEESINWPDPDDQETFEKQLLMKTLKNIQDLKKLLLPYTIYTYDYAGGLITTDYIEIYEIEIEDEPFDEFLFLGNIIIYASEYDLFENLRENLIRMDLTKGADDQYYDYSPSQVEAILFGILQLTPEHQDIIVIDLKKHLKSFIQDKDQAEEMITQYTCYYNAIKRWESNHEETEILHQLEISNLLEQLKNN